MSNSITALDEAASIQSTSLFVAAQQDKYICSKYNSCQISSIDLVNVLKDKVFKMRGFNDAAYMLSSAFSEAEHEHDDMYNQLDISVCYKPPKEDASMISIGNLFVDGTLMPVSMPISSVTQIWDIPFSIIEPKVGMLKFVASSSIGSNSGIAYKSQSFDGWLYPDGSTFNLSDFVLSNDINALFGTGDRRTFRLPVVQKFIMPNGSLRKESGSMIAELSGRNVLYKHDHLVDMLIDMDITMAMQVPVNPAAGNGGRFHGGGGKIEYDVQLKVTPAILSNGTSYTMKQCIAGNVPNNKNKNITQFEDTLKKIDADNADRAQDVFYNGDSLYDRYKELNIFSLNQIPGLSINAQASLNSTLGIQPEGNDADETYPRHINLPVMIYVGQRKRSYK